MRCLILSSYPKFHAVLAIGLFVLPEWKGRVLSAKHYPGFGDTACPKGGVLGLGELEGWHQSLLQRCLAPYEGRGPPLVTPRALRWISKPCPRARRFQVFSGSKQRLAGGCPLSPAPRGCLHLSRGPSLLSVSPGGCEGPLPARSRGRPRRRVPYPAAPPCGQPGFGGALGTVTRRLGVPHGSAMPGGAEGQRSFPPSCAGLRGTLLPPRGRCSGSGSRGQHDPR